jgi:hypothetical protein
MKIARFSYPVDRWVNEGVAYPRDAGSVSEHLRIGGGGSASRWRCRFSPGSSRQSFSPNPRRFRRNPPLRDFAHHPSTAVAELGSTLCVQDLDRTYLNVFTLVEPQSSEAAGPLLSVSSPLGRALLGTSAGDLVELVGRKGSRRLLVKAILPRRPRPK